MNLDVELLLHTIKDYLFSQGNICHSVTTKDITRQNNAMVLEEYAGALTNTV